MTRQEKKWFSDLEKHLKAMPNKYDIAVCIDRGGVSQVSLHPRGFHDDVTDMTHGFKETEISSFIVSGVIPNSECIG